MVFNYLLMAVYLFILVIILIYVLEREDDDDGCCCCSSLALITFFVSVIVAAWMFPPSNILEVGLVVFLGIGLPLIAFVAYRTRQEAQSSEDAIDKARSDYLRTLAAMSGTTVETPTEGSDQLDFLLQQKDRLEAALTDLRFDYMRGYIPESEYKTKETELDSQLEDLDKQIARPIGTTPTTPLIVEEDYEPSKTVPVAPPPEVPEEGVHVLRGCAAVGGRFEYKVKVRNETSSVITNATVTILSYPDYCMEISGSTVKTIKRIGPGEFRSPQFTFVPTKDCVEGRIITTVSYIDHHDEPHTLQVEPYMIRSVCDLLEPLESTMQQFELILGDLEHTSEEHVLPWNPEVLFSKVKAFLPSRNFHIVGASGDTIGEVFTGTIRGLAEGKYTGKKVAVRILISGPAEGNEVRVVVEGLGEDIAMLPTTIDEIARGIESWTCMNCGAALEPDEVSQIKAGAPVRCRYCRHTMTIDLYRK